MTGGHRDVEADIRAGLAEGARTFVVLIRRGNTNAEGAIDGLVRKAFGSPEQLRDALDLLGEDEQEPRALLTRALRYAGDPRAPEPPKVRERPDALYATAAPGGRAPAYGPARNGGGGCLGDKPPPA